MQKHIVIGLIFILILSCKKDEPINYDLIGEWVVRNDTFSESSTWRTIEFTGDSMLWTGRDYTTQEEFFDVYAYEISDFTYLLLTGSGDQSGELRYVFNKEDRLRVFNVNGGLSLNRRN